MAKSLTLTRLWHLCIVTCAAVMMMHHKPPRLVYYAPWMLLALLAMCIYGASFFPSVQQSSAARLLDPLCRGVQHVSGSIVYNLLRAQGWAHGALKHSSLAASESPSSTSLTPSNNIAASLLQLAGLLAKSSLRLILSAFVELPVTGASVGWTLLGIFAAWLWFQEPTVEYKLTATSLQVTHGLFRQSTAHLLIRNIDDVSSHTTCAQVLGLPCLGRHCTIHITAERDPDQTEVIIPWASTELWDRLAHLHSETNRINGTVDAVAAAGARVGRGIPAVHY